MSLTFRDLRADEIDCRVAQVSREGKGFSLLLYKDARCDMNILDEAVGCMNWQRSHTRDNANCIVSIWDEDKKAWVSKEDTGTESNTEAEKGLASDSFKRACFNWGIGRELYTAPFIWVSEGDPKKDKFAVESIVIEDKKITALSIKNIKTGEIVYTYGMKSKKTAPKKAETKAAEEPKKPKFPNRNEFLKYCDKEKLDTAGLCAELGLTTKSEDKDFIEGLKKAKEKVEERDKATKTVEVEEAQAIAEEADVITEADQIGLPFEF